MKVRIFETKQKRNEGNIMLERRACYDIQHICRHGGNKTCRFAQRVKQVRSRNTD